MVFQPRNAILDFSPLSNALGAYTQGVNANAKREQWNALADTMTGVDPTLAPMIRAAGPDKGPQMFMQAYGQGHDRAFRQKQFDASRTDADRSYGIQKQQLGLSAASNARQAEMHRMEVETRRAEQRLPIASMILQEPDPARRSQMFQQFAETDPQFFSKMPPSLRANPDMAARWMYGQARKQFESGQPKVMERDPSKDLVRVGPSGQSNVIMPAREGGKMSDTTRKEIQETDDFIKSSRAAVGNLEKALQLHEQAYAGFGAATRANVVSNTVGALVKRPGAAATTELDSLITDQALQSLRAIFGGNPTEGERKILLEVAGSVSQPAEVRGRILQRAMSAARQRLWDYTNKGEALRTGDFYKPGWQPPPMQSGSPSLNSAQMAAPAGNTKDPSGMSDQELLKSLGITP